jgi:hypothetical protein
MLSIVVLGRDILKFNLLSPFCHFVLTCSSHFHFHYQKVTHLFFTPSRSSPSKLSTSKSISLFFVYLFLSFCLSSSLCLYTWIAKVKILKCFSFNFRSFSTLEVYNTTLIVRSHLHVLALTLN